MMKKGLTNDQLWRLCIRAMIPTRFLNATIREIPEFPYKAKLVKYLQTFKDMRKQGVGLFLYSSENSTGKTSIASALLKYGIQKGCSGLFVRAGSLQEWKIENKEFEGNQTLYGRARCVDLLIIDDLNKEFKGKSGFFETILEDLIRIRSQDLKITIITSNIDPSDITLQYSRSLAELLKEYMLPVHVVGKNWRDAEKLKLSAMWNVSLEGGK